MGSPADALFEPRDSLLASAARSGQANIVTSADKWPGGLERQRPRVVQGPAIAAGALLGGGVGALLGALISRDGRDASENAAIGAAAGAIAGGLGGSGVTRALSLDQSLRLALAKLGVVFVSLRQYGRYEARLVFEVMSSFKVAQAKADPTRSWEAEELDDWLYRKLIVAVVEDLENSETNQ
jgi:outer membrane lipoprotein SlyB